MLLISHLSKVYLYSTLLPFSVCVFKHSADSLSSQTLFCEVVSLTRPLLVLPQFPLPLLWGTQEDEPPLIH